MRCFPANAARKDGWSKVVAKLPADANAIHVNVPQDQLDMPKLDELGWKVYPEE